MSLGSEIRREFRGNSFRLSSRPLSPSLWDFLAGVLSDGFQWPSRASQVTGTRSTNRSMKWLLENGKATPAQIHDTLCKQTVELVFTAHPTQVGPSLARACGLRHTLQPRREQRGVEEEWVVRGEQFCAEMGGVAWVREGECSGNHDRILEDPTNRSERCIVNVLEMNIGCTSWVVYYAHAARSKDVMECGT